MTSVAQCTQTEGNSSLSGHVLGVTLLVVTSFVTCGTIATLYVYMPISVFLDDVSTTLTDTTNTVVSALLILSLLSLFALSKWLREDDELHGPQQTMTDHTDKTIVVSQFNRAMLSQCLTGFLALTSLIVPVFTIIASVACFSTETSLTSVYKVVLNALLTVFILCQTTFMVCAKRHKCATWPEAISITFLVSTNISLCVKNISDATQQTLENKYTYGDTNAAYKSVFCENQSDIITKGFEAIDQHLRTPIFLFCMCSFETLCVIWNLFDRLPNATGSVDNTRSGNEDGRFSESMPLLPISHLQKMSQSRKSLSSKFKRYLIALCQYSYIPTSVLCVGILASNIYIDAKLGFIQPSNGTVLHEDTAFRWVQFIYINFISGAAFVGFLLVRTNEVSRGKLLLKHMLMIVAACFHLVLLILETIDSIANFKHHPAFEVIILFLLKTIFHYIGLFSEVLFILKTTDMQRHKDTAKSPYVKGILYFLAICYLERSIVDSFLTPAAVRYASSLSRDFFGIDNWEVFTRLLLPGVAFFRLKESLLSFENVQKM